MSTFRGLGEVIAENGLFCSLYADRGTTGTRPRQHGKFVLIFVAGSQHSIMGQRPVLAPERLGAGFGWRAAL